MNLNVIWRFLFGVGELTHISVCKKETASIMLKTLGATIQHFNAWEAMRPGILLTYE